MSLGEVLYYKGNIDKGNGGPKTRAKMNHDRSINILIRNNSIGISVELDDRKLSLIFILWLWRGFLDRSR